MRFASSALLFAIFVYYVAPLIMWCTGRRLSKDVLDARLHTT